MALKVQQLYKQLGFLKGTFSKGLFYFLYDYAIISINLYYSLAAIAFADFSSWYDFKI
jgi:hypothetical protein